MIWSIALVALFFIGFVWRTNNRLDKLERASESRASETATQNRK
jgi:hypothetical protein